MTKVLFNGSIQGFRGRIGNLIFRQLPDGTTVVSEAPRKKTRKEKKRDNLKRSAAQQAHNNRFKEAAVYAREAQVHPVYVELAATLPMKTAYNCALSDWWNAPVINRIEQRQGRILVEASDNVMVTRVQVTILDEEGRVMEQGEALRQEGDWWAFDPQTQGSTVTAAAWDLPGNVTEHTGQPGAVVAEAQ